MIIPVILLAIVGILLLRINLPTIKGKIGETRVANILKSLPQNEYVVLNDLLFEYNSSTTQIDHIVISVNGVFVIETKNHKGWIFGNTFKDYWTQNIWGHKYSIYNPLLQNENHIHCLLNKFEALKERELSIYSIVVFCRASKLNLSGECDNVLFPDEIISYIYKHTQPIMTIYDCHYIANTLKANNLEAKEDRKAHKANVMANINRYKETIKGGICPRCGGNLVLRNGKYGKFYGCSNFPRCRYTR